ncbi:hypothetical protein [Allochromatium vinosum]|uniref:Uncharacterized protein n=1 Tax=Allochromatium vinosum (strain ATCC 17899 / DSM 180 / NBRC 103801 / NCIMB 10441 / D) TaxID=572477 RepID=D3RW75_ALLVD|nr:hypothetical protein [Allochromatium vinosum]ADC64087.1 conserved hypothetical protein [Allochromatium vinosum DSM 180]
MESREQDRWFGAGWAVYKGSMGDDCFPPLNDIDAQRAWLGGFGAAWVEYSDADGSASILIGDGMGGESLHDALASALKGHSVLLQQLLAHRDGWSNRTVH